MIEISSLQCGLALENYTLFRTVILVQSHVRAYLSASKLTNLLS